MKQGKHALMDLILDIVEGVKDLKQLIKRNTKPIPSLIAHNIHWFTNCSWCDQLIAFKQIDRYYANKI